MKTIVSCALFAATMFGIPAIAAAADDAMMKPAMPNGMATMMCRPAQTGEKATAMMGKKAIVCKTIDMGKMDAMKKSMDAMPGGDKLYQQWMQDFNITPFSG
jgi:hypothetical protein